MVCRVGVAASTTIPPRSMVNVDCKVEKDSTVAIATWVLEPEHRFEKCYTVGIIKIAATVNNRTVPVRMFNRQPRRNSVLRRDTRRNSERKGNQETLPNQ